MKQTADIINHSDQTLELLDQLLAEEGIELADSQTILRRQNLKEYPLSFGQQRLWFLDQLEQGTHYNEGFYFRLALPLDVAALEKTLAEILRRHEALRATFVLENGGPVQKISPATAVKLPLIDLRNVPAAGQMDAARRMAEEEIGRRFDLSRGPLWRFQLLRLAEADHLLLATVHHIVIDGWSRAVFLEELSALYAAFAERGSASGFPELPIQYADFAAWQRETLQGAALEQDLAYWQQQLAGPLTVLELPTDRPRPPVQTFDGACQFFEVPASLVESLKELGRSEGATLFMVVLAAFQTLLHRYSGQDEIIFGSPVAGRPRKEVERLIGFFLNLIALRTRFGGDPTFRELLRQVRDMSLGAFAHQNLPLDRLLETLHLERNLRHGMLFQVLFIFQNTPRAECEIPGITLNEFHSEQGTAMYDLNLSINEGPDGMCGWLVYKTGLFDDATITRILGQFRVLLESLIADPDRKLSELPLLTQAERRQLLEGWNNTGTPPAPFQSVHQWFESQAERTPDAVAVVFEGKQLTYRELNARANQLAHLLSGLGVKTETLVGLCLDRSLEMVVAVLAVLKAGGAYVPLDPDYPKDRVAFILEDARTPVVVTQEGVLSRFGIPTSKFKVLLLDKNWETIAKQSAANPAAGTTADYAAYVIYTSGSTGKPKGVVVTHRAVVNFLDSMRVRPGLTAQDTLLAITTLSFDIAGLELLLPLVVGGKVVVARRETVLDGNRLAVQLKECGATVMQGTPATWRSLLEAGWPGDTHLKILCGGEAWTPELAQQLLPRCALLWNMYGPTETTIWSAALPIESGQAVLIGGPIANTQLHVLDGRLQPVPIGVPGELHIGGDGLARGYLNRPEMTAEKFIRDPFSRQPGARLYKTGDMARYRSDGRIEFLGRADHQVKIRGYRIELGEIEAALRQHPNVREAVVIAREWSSGDKRLAAYVIPQKTPAPATSELRQWVQEKLPDYMVPSAFMALEAFPLTPNGKVDRRALPSPELTRLDSEAAFVAPRTPVEQKLAEIWCALLGVKQVGVNDNFYSLGGHSLLATQVISQIRVVLQTEVTLRDLFEAPTIAGLGAVVEKNKRQAAGPAMPALVALPRKTSRGSTPPPAR